MIESSTQITDKLALRIAARRATAIGAQVSDGNLNRPMVVHDDSELEQVKFNNIARSLAGAVVNANCDKIVLVSEAIASGENPIAIARLLAELKLKNSEIAVALGKSKSWVSKRLSLLEAPRAVQRLIETGELSESEYHNHRGSVPSGIKNTGGELKYQRTQTVEITLEAARALAMILSDLAVVSEAAPIRLEPDASKKQIENILNERAAEMQKRLK